jgi:hypothetical protein
MNKNYSGIIDTKWPPENSKARPRMDLSNRAKIFLPFAALKGYEEEISKKQKIVVPKSELSEDMKERLDLRFRQIASKLQNKNHPMVTVIYFKKDLEADTGIYLELTGMVAKLDSNLRFIQLVNNRINLDDIYDIYGEIFE